MASFGPQFNLQNKSITLQELENILSGFIDRLTVEDIHCIIQEALHWVNSKEFPDGVPDWM
jgi:hypothetical protein